jgi:formate hydrogenlyase subunit 6/NADH:ubiquinone oxidoreductase subunit I
MILPFLREASKNLFSKPSTEAFPAAPAPAKPNYRGRISYDPEKCVNCGMCKKVCSPAAITTEIEEVEGGQKITYHFDLTSCTFCGTCQDFCDEKAIVLTDDYLMVAENKEDLIVSGSRIKPVVKGKLTCDTTNCIYCGLCARNCPEEAITVDRATKSWTVDHDKCIQCGKCISKCPKKVLSFAEPAPEGVIFGEGCVYCGICAKKCPVSAITVDRATKSWTIDRDTCIKCGQCVKNCPKKALSMGPIEE